MLSCASVAVSDWLLLLGLCWPTRSCSGSSGLPWWWWLPRTTAGEEGRGRGHKEDGECGGLESQPSKFCGAQELPWASSVAGTHDTAHGRACICYGSCEECGLLCCGCSTASPRQLARGGGGGFGGGDPRTMDVLGGVARPQYWQSQLQVDGSSPRRTANPCPGWPGPLCTQPGCEASPAPVSSGLEPGKSCLLPGAPRAARKN